jgi:diaminohydroxyphosphoribosylaminopyrimidine deaminase/5-amino-6-(5-phosphoribosylamino)uracil reductase
MEGKWLNRRFFCFHQQQRPYIILKWAQTNDGFLAPTDGSRMQLTGKPAQELVHKWRTEEAAIMVGTATARNDNPQLTARLVQGKQPLRIVLDRQLSLPAVLNIYANDARTWIVNEGKETVEGHISFIKLDFDTTLLAQLMHKLYNAGIQSVIVEGGARLLNSFMEAGLWDEARIFTAPVQLGDGIHAPVLNTNAVFKTAIGEDALELYVNDKSNYPYVGGMEL